MSEIDSRGFIVASPGSPLPYTAEMARRHAEERPQRYLSLLYKAIEKEAGDGANSLWVIGIKRKLQDRDDWVNYVCGSLRNAGYTINDRYDGDIVIEWGVK